MLKLRQYQNECLDAIENSLKKKINRQLVYLPTGSGKTVIFSELIKRKAPLKVLVIAHTNELLSQSKDKLLMIYPEANPLIVNAESKNIDSNIIISSIQTASKEFTLENLAWKNFDVLIIDECHHAAANTYKKLISMLGFDKGTNKLLLGFTATPQRADKKGLKPIFDKIIYKKTVLEMVEAGYLCRPFATKVKIDLSQVETDGEDFKKTKLSDVVNTEEYNELLVNTYLIKGENRKTICFGASVDHAKNLTELFQKHGIPSKYISGDMPLETREAILKEYAENKIQVLCNCQILTEGYDDPATSCIIVGSPTKSLSKYTQMVGRGLRKFINKRGCLVIDFTDQNVDLCSVEDLLEDSTTKKIQKKEKKSTFKIPPIPKKLHAKLKAILEEANLMSTSFFWKKIEPGYKLDGSTGIVLGVLEQKEPDKWQVVLKQGQENEKPTYNFIAKDMSFDFAFSTAEDFARENRHLFVLGDRNASWRNDPITEGQIKALKKFRYTADVYKLTKGQASTILDELIQKANGD